MEHHNASPMTNTSPGRCRPASKKLNKNVLGSQDQVITPNQEKISDNRSDGSRVKWRNLLKNKIILAFVILSVICIVSEFYSCSPDKCLVIYDIMKELKADMSREQVLSIIEKHDTQYIVKSYNSPKEYFSPEEAKGEYISIWVHYTLTDTLRLSIWFHDNKLYMTKIRGENGTENFKDAPPEILPGGQVR